MEKMYDVNTGFTDVQTMASCPYICGFCSNRISSEKGYGLYNRFSGRNVGGVHICPQCGGPTFLMYGVLQVPRAAIGKPVNHLPESLQQLYEETRDATTHGCFTGAVLLARKMLMNIAVTQGADAGKPFIFYVSYLSDKGYVPPNGRHWVDHIRKKGNEATHEIVVMREEDAKDLLTFIEMLLRFIYEFPAMVPAAPEKG